jgi:hypothetical protein
MSHQQKNRKSAQTAGFWTGVVIHLPENVGYIEQTPQTGKDEHTSPSRQNLSVAARCCAESVGLHTGHLGWLHFCEYARVALPQSQAQSSLSLRTTLNLLTRYLNE